MKKLTTTIVMALALCATAPAQQFKEKARQIQTLYQQAVKEMQSGDIESSRINFKKVLKLQPNHGHALYHLGRLDVVGKKFVLQKRKNLFQTTKIPVVDFHEATLEEALDHLNIETQKLTKKEFNPNFMIQDSKGAFKGKPITLNMKNVPLSAALKYVLDMTEATARFDQHGTVIRPR